MRAARIVRFADFVVGCRVWYDNFLKSVRLKIMENVRFVRKFWNKVQPRDVIALVVLLVIFSLFAMGYDGWLQGIGAMIIGYYFSKRVYEEKNRK